MAQDQKPNDANRRRESRGVYDGRHFGQRGGYGQQSRPGLNYGGATPPERVPPSRRFGGYHLSGYEARHYGGESEREPGHSAGGTHGRFSEDR